MMKNRYTKVSPKEEEDGDVELSTIGCDDDDFDFSTDSSDDGEEHLAGRLPTYQESKEEGNDRRIELWRLENLAVPMCYFTVGLVQGITLPVINVYPLDLQATEAQQQTLWFLKGLPSCLKIFFGFLSDNVPIFGYRRKVYMVAGFTLSSLSMLVLLLFSDLSLTRVEEDDGASREVIPPENAPSIALLSAVFFLWAAGVWFSDVMGDSLVAEKAKYESDDNRGNLQTICYLLRGFGIAIMYPISTLAYSSVGPAIVIAAAAAAPLVLLPFVYFLKELKIVTIDGPAEQLQQLFDTACSRAVWQPMGFVYIYLVLFVSNAAWKEFLKSVLGFSPNQLNALLFVAGAFAFFGVVMYKFLLQKWSWRTIFILGMAINGVFSLLQVLLIRGQTFGLSPFVFSLGDDAVRDFVIGTQYIPVCVMMVNLVPEGIEGASYALFTTTWNAGQGLADALSTILLTVWDVSKETMMSGNLRGIQRLTILTTALQVLPLLFVRLMPHSVHDLALLKRTDHLNDDASSKLGGYIYLIIVLLSVLAAIFIGVMNVVQPGWMGES